MRPRSGADRTHYKEDRVIKVLESIDSVRVLSAPGTISQVADVIRQQLPEAKIESRDEDKFVAVMGSRIKYRLFGASSSNYKHLPVSVSFSLWQKDANSTQVHVKLTRRAGWYPVQAPWVPEVYERRFAEIIGQFSEVGMSTE